MLIAKRGPPHCLFGRCVGPRLNSFSLIGRQADAENMYWRVTQFLMPFWSMTGPYGENPVRQSRAWLPMDDHTTMTFAITFPCASLTMSEKLSWSRPGSP